MKSEVVFVVTGDGETYAILKEEEEALKAVNWYKNHPGFSDVNIRFHRQGVLLKWDRKEWEVDNLNAYGDYIFGTVQFDSGEEAWDYFNKQCDLARRSGGGASIKHWGDTLKKQNYFCKNE